MDQNERRVTICLLISAWCILVGAARAQNNLPAPGQLMPRPLAPELPSPTLSIPQSVTDFAADKAVADVELTISAFDLEGADPALGALAEQQLAPLRNHKVRVDVLYSAIAALEQSWVDRGHFLTRIIIPPQHVAEGQQLHLEVIRGFIQWLDADAVPVLQRARVVAILTPLVNDPHISRGQFERALVLASEVPGWTLAASLRPGPAVGAVVLVVSGDEHLDFGQLAVDNTLPHLLGGASATLSTTYIALEGPVGQLYFTGSAPVTSDPFSSSSQRTLVVAGVRSDVGVDGAAIDSSLSWSRTKPESSPGVIDTASNFDRAAVRGTYPLIKNRNSTLIVDFGVDATQEQETAPQFGKTLYDDQLRVLRAGISATHVFDLRWQGAAGIDVSQGLHLLGARGPAQATADDSLSQQGASDVFTKWEWRASMHGELPESVALDMQLHGQDTRHPLLLAEKFTLGGPTDLSAYDTASFSGDRGWAIRGEVQLRWDSHMALLSSNAQAYLFAAHGQAAMIAPTAVEQHTSIGSSAGLGIRTTTRATNRRFGTVDLAVEVAREFNPAVPPIPGDWEVHFSTAIHF